MTTYIKGSAKEIEGQYGKFLSLGLNFEDLKKHVNEKGYVNLNVSPRREIGQYGDTHSVSVNEYKPKEEFEPPKESKSLPQDEIDINSIPF